MKKTINAVSKATIHIIKEAIALVVGLTVIAAAIILPIAIPTAIVVWTLRFTGAI